MALSVTTTVVPFRRVVHSTPPGPAVSTARVPDNMKFLFDGQTWACSRGERMFVVSRGHSARDEWNWWFRDLDAGIDITTFRNVPAELVGIAVGMYGFDGRDGWHVNEEVYHQ